MCDDLVRARLERGEVLEVLKGLSPASFHGLLCDPPYGLGTGPGRPAWDGQVPPPAVWAQVARLLVPGAWVLAFGGRRTYHRLMVAMEDGGLELRDVLTWLYGTGMPSARTCLRPGWEPVVMARNPGATQEPQHRRLPPSGADSRLRPAKLAPRHEDRLGDSR